MEGAMGFDDFIDTAWTDHAARAADVASRLEEHTARVETVDQLAPYAALAAHVLGEHLGEWDRGIRLLHTLRALPACRGDATTLATLARHEAALRYASGDTPPFDALAPDEQLAALASAASMLAGRAEWARAIRALDDALEGAQAGLPAGSPAIRALAVAGNNIAAALEEKPERSVEQTRAMLRAAHTGLSHWRRAGTWLEEERAEYRLARSMLQAGDATGAAQAAQRCLDVCAANDAPAFERFFGAAALALALRALGQVAAFEAARGQARGWHAQIPADERSWCAGDLAELE
jgi:hypothetical protein